MGRLSLVVALAICAGLAAAGRLDARPSAATGTLVLSTDGAGAVPTGAVYTVNADGPALHRLTAAAGTNIAPSWSPNGLKLAWIHTNLNPKNSDASPSQLWAANADGSGVRKGSSLGVG